MGWNGSRGCASVLAMLAMAGCQIDSPTNAFARFRDDARQEYRTNQLRIHPEAERLSPEPTFKEYIAYAEAHNAGLEAAFNRWKAAVERIVQAKSLPDPHLSYRYYISEVETRVGAMRQGINVSQVFPWFEKLLYRSYVAADDTQAMAADMNVRRWRLRQEVTEAYWELYYLDRSIKVIGENMRLVEHLESVARTKYKVSTASHPDVIRAQVELGKLEDRLASLQDMRAPAAARLNAAINRSIGNPVATIKPGDDDSFVEIAEKYMIHELRHTSPKLFAMQAEINRRRHEVKLAELAYVPDLTLGVDYTDINDSTGGRHPSDDGKDAVAVMATINLPIWVDRIEAGIREARHRQLAAILAKRQEADDLTASLKQRAFEYRDAQRKLLLYRDTLLPKAQQLVKTNEAAFRAGTSTFLDLVDAQRVLLEFDLAVARARADRAQSRARIEALMSRKLEALAADVAAAARR